ncbi:MAG: hemolysin family protein [Lachnospiraceae bacterium]|nr:hemolysin family protein [Lachnospiraceae bacterium]
MDTVGAIQIVVLIVLLLLSSFFSSSETALSSIGRVKARSLEEEGRKHAKVLNLVLDNYDKMLTTILIGNNIVNIAASALATTFALRMFGSYAISIATGILTLLVLIFGEIVPKTAARKNAEFMSLSFAPIIRFLMIVLSPIVFIVDKLSGGILILFGQNLKKGDVITETELRTYVDVSHEDGVIKKDEHKMINNVFDFSDSVAKDIMIPRIDLTSVEMDSSYDEVMSVFEESMYTRLPVYACEKENIRGFINVKDLFFLSDKDKEEFAISHYLREAYYTYEFKKTNDLMLEMRKAALSISFVNNEYGETVGMITLEDLLEEIVGEIRDEYDSDEDNFIVEENGGYMILGSVKLEDVNDSIGTEFSSEDYDSIGGLILDELDRIPRDKESVTLEDGTILTVCGMKQNRILKVFVKLPEVAADDETALSEQSENA